MNHSINEWPEDRPTDRLAIPQGRQVHLEAVRAGVIAAHKGHDFIRDGNGSIGTICQAIGRTAQSRLQCTGRGIMSGVIIAQSGPQKMRTRGEVAAE